MFRKSRKKLAFLRGTRVFLKILVQKLPTRFSMRSPSEFFCLLSEKELQKLSILFLAFKGMGLKHFKNAKNFFSIFNIVPQK